MAYITLDQAASLIGSDISGLINLCHSARIPIEILHPENIQMISEGKLLENLTLTQQPEYQAYKHMAGKGIGIREAGQKYGIAHQTICRWVAAGWLPVIARDGRKKLVDRAVMAYAAEIYSRKAGQGRWVFKHNGVPYRRE